MSGTGIDVNTSLMKRKGRKEKKERREGKWEVCERVNIWRRPRWAEVNIVTFSPSVTMTSLIPFLAMSDLPAISICSMVSVGDPDSLSEFIHKQS